VLPVVAALPALRAVARAVRVGWVPIADEGIIALRAHDVLTARTPALGQMSLASGTSGAPTRSPGPLGYWVLAPAAQVGPPWLVSAAAGLVAIVAVVLAVHLAGRRGGLPLAVVVTTGLVLSARAFDPVNLAVGWNPSIGLVPMALLVLLAWSVGVGDRGWFPATVAVASFLGQIHVAYLLPALVAVAVAAVGGWGADVAGWWRARRAGEVPVRPDLRPVAIGVAVGLVLWALPLLQQALRRPGNLTLVSRSAGGDTQGLGFAAKVVAWGIGLPPAAVRGAAGGWEAAARLEPGRITRLGAVAVVMALVGLAILGLRRRDREVAVPPLLVLGLLASALVVFRATPTDGRGVSALYTSWWLIPTGMLAWVVLGATTLRVAPGLTSAVRRRAGARPALAPVAAAVVVALTAAVALGTPMNDPEDHLYGVARRAGDAVVAEVRPGDRYEVQALGMVGFQLASGLAYRIRRAGGHPVIRGGDGVSAGPEYVPRGERCDAVVGLVNLEPGAASPEPADGGEVLLVVDVPPGPAVDVRRLAVTWTPDAGPPSC
jgi:hypothetical protein